MADIPTSNGTIIDDLNTLQDSSERKFSESVKSNDFAKNIDNQILNDKTQQISDIIFDPDISSNVLIEKNEPRHTHDKSNIDVNDIHQPVITSFNTNNKINNSNSSNDSLHTTDFQSDPNVNLEISSENVKSMSNPFKSEKAEDSLAIEENSLPACSDSSHQIEEHFILHTLFSAPDNLSIKSSEFDSEEEFAIDKQQKLFQVERLEIQLECVESSNQLYKKEVSSLKEQLANQEIESNRQLSTVKQELNEQIDKLANQLLQCQKERDNMVMKYAQSEIEVMKYKKHCEEQERKLKQIQRERDNTMIKLNTSNVEKAKLASMLDIKHSSVLALQKENDSFKEEVKTRDIKIKWGQNKLKAELESHKETKSKLDNTLLRLKEAREESEQIRHDCQEMVRHYQTAEETKSATLDQALQAKLSELEEHMQEQSGQQQVYAAAKKEMENFKIKLKLLTEENNSLTLKIHTLEKERLEHEQIVSRLKETQSILHQDQVDLTAQLAEMDNLRLQLEREQQKLVSSQKETEWLHHANVELQADIEACHSKEGELLQFTERLTTKSVQLQSEHSLLETKAQTSHQEVLRLTKALAEMETRLQENEDANKKLLKTKSEEAQLLIKKLAEKTKSVEMLNTRLDELENEARVLKRRHLTSIKELTRELQQTKRKLEASNEALTRSSSATSLDTVQASPTPQVSDSPKLDQRVLVDRIIKLQKTLANKSEKLEFFQEHINFLVNELKKKSKIIQSYVLREETGALAPDSMDSNKVEVARRGGVMASVFSSQLSDVNLTLELSLEINHKLQAVLEDTLLKNITLKENLNTLGQEIARLTLG